MAIRSIVRRISGTAAAVTLAAGAALVSAAPASASPITNIGYDLEILALHSGKCLEIADWRTDDGAPLRQWSCTGGDNQKWRFNADGTIVNVHSGKCLEVPGWKFQAGVQVGQWTCHGGGNQKWEGVNRIPELHSLAIVSSSAWDLVFDVAGVSTDDGAPVLLWWPGGGYNQQFAFDPEAPGA
ncbi:RICIN domain-containing protein [Kitasatospora sp. NPDC057692]|uniref:RICIN domain-containing protein n=1 Tax=Kitasatospora sp. NPDC057692 TaxID=3346215 RepID=UPI00369160BB